MPPELGRFAPGVGAEVAVALHVGGGMQQLEPHARSAMAAGREALTFNCRDLVGHAVAIVDGQVDARLQHPLPGFKRAGC